MVGIAEKGLDEELNEISSRIDDLKRVVPTITSADPRLASLEKEYLEKLNKYQDARNKSQKKKAFSEKISQTTTAVSSALSGLLLIVALGIHLYHGIFLGFAMVWSQLIPIYFSLAILIAIIMTMNDSNGWVSFFRHVGTSILLVAINLLIMFVLVYAVNNFSNPFIEDFSGFLLLLFPPLVYFLVFSPDYATPSWMQTVAAIIILVFAVGFVIAFIGNFTLPIPDNYQGIDATQGFKNTWERLVDGAKSFGDKTYSAINQTQQRLDPNYYVGQVEQNEHRPLGVRLEEVGPIDPEFFPNQSATIVGYITAETFLDDEISVGVTCVVDRRGSEATVSTAPVSVFYGHDELFECTFVEGFAPGTYPVDVQAEFMFETWADITYDFVLEEKALAFARLQQDIYRELDITQEPHSIYTNGPVMLGMGGSRMPILVTDEPPYLKNAVLGFTLQSKWPRGELGKVEELELIIPQTFELTSCDRWADIKAFGPVEDENVPSYHKYVFTNPTTGAPFTSVRCEMALTSPDALADIVANDKVTRTFIARAKYNYVLTEETRIRVAG